MGSRSDRGLRNPRHTFGIQTPNRKLMPFMMAPMRPGNVQMFFPECNPLITPGVRDPDSQVPDYNAVVELLPA